MENNNSNIHRNNSSTASMLSTMSSIAGRQERYTMGLFRLQARSWDRSSTTTITTLTPSHVSTMNNNRNINHYNTEHTIIHTNIMLFLTPNSSTMHSRDTSTSCRQPRNITTSTSLFQPQLRP